MNSLNLIQAYVESLIWFGSTRTKLMMFLNLSWSICGSTILSLLIIVTKTNIILIINVHDAVCSESLMLLTDQAILFHSTLLD